MKINRILTSAKTFSYHQKNSLQAKRLHKYFNMDNLDTINNEAFNQIYSAKEGLAKYAKAHNIRIELTDVDYLSKKASPDTMNIIVRNLNNKNRLVMSKISTDTTQVFPKVSEETIILPIKGEDVEIVRTVKSRTEDNFIRHLYRTIGDLKDAFERNF